MRLYLAVAFYLLLGGSLISQTKPQKYGVEHHSVPEGLQVGSTAPEINLSDHEGTRYVLSDILKTGPVVLTFYRGNWCPYCSRFLATLEEHIADIEKKGAHLLAVSPEDETQIVHTYNNKTEGNITLLHDEGGAIMHAYDVAFEVTDEYQEKIEAKKDVDIATHNDQEDAMLPVAATYVIDKDGQIVYRHFDLDYSQRAPLAEILQALDQLN